MTNTQTVIPGGAPAETRNPDKKIVVEIVDRKNKILSGVTIEPNAAAQYIFLLTDDAGGFTDERTIIIRENAQADVFLCYFGSGNVTVKLTYDIERNARVNHKLLFFGNGRQRLHFDERYIFKSTSAYGRFSVQGLVTDEAQSNAVGNIMIQPGAQKTDSRLEMSAYILSESAKASMVPSLQIQANDVRAGHAGKVSQLGKEELFYLQSRGLNEAQAKRLFIEGLFLEFVKDIDNKNIREKILTIAKKRYE